MKKLLCIFVLITGIHGFVTSQVANDKLQQAGDYLNKEDYNNALQLFRELREQTSKTDSLYPDIAYGLSASLFYVLLDVKAKDDWSRSVELLTEFINSLEEDKDYLNPKLQEQVYWSYKDLVVAYFGLNQLDKAKMYQEKLYAAYKAKKLPEGLDAYYNFEKFVFNNQNVWGYEWFAELGDKGTEGSFAKHIYYIYSRDSLGNDVDQLYTLQTLKIHKFKNEGADFVLTKLIYGDEQDIRESIWTYTFYNPVDYVKLHDAILEYLKGNVTSDAKSIINH